VSARREVVDVPQRRRDRKQRHDDIVNAKAAVAVLRESAENKLADSIERLLREIRP
jgi:hypothetical protein